MISQISQLIALGFRPCNYPNPPKENADEVTPFSAQDFRVFWGGFRFQFMFSNTNFVKVFAVSIFFDFLLVSVGFHGKKPPKEFSLCLMPRQKQAEKAPVGEL